jgi:hypothetical protein
MAARYVVVGLARPRATWFGDVGRWATSGAAPVDFVRCVSAEELRARLGSGRAFSAVLVDGAVGGLDRDLVDAAREAGAAVVVVDDGTRARDWQQLAVDGVLAAPFSRQDLVALLEARATSVSAVRPLPVADEEVVEGRRGHLFAVTGAGGTGASTLAMALAQALADVGRVGGSGPADDRRLDAGFGTPADGEVVLADLALHGDQAMFHDAPDIVPGVTELVEAHRLARPSAPDLRASTFTVVGRGYRLLLGLRRHRDWSALRPRAVEAAVEGLCSAFGAVVADIDADLEGEADCGAVEVEERNVLARTAARRADVVFVVGTSGLKGVHALARTVAHCAAAGVEPGRIVPVVNHAPRAPRQRAEVSRALADLLSGALSGGKACGPVFVAHQRRVENLLRDGARLPAPLGAPLLGAARAVVERHLDAAAPRAAGEPEAVRPGSLGGWFSDRAAS